MHLATFNFVAHRRREHQKRLFNDYVIVGCVADRIDRVKAVYAKREGGFLLLHIVQVSSTLHPKTCKYFLNHLRENLIWLLNHHVIVGLVADRVGRQNGSNIEW